MYPIEILYDTGLTLYAVIRNPDGTIWNTNSSAWEVYNAAHWALYVIPLTEATPSGYYRASYPTAITGIHTSEIVYSQAGANPAVTDDKPIGLGQSQGSNIAAVAGNAAVPANLAASLSSMITGSVVSAGTTPTVTAFQTSLTDSANSVYVGRLVVFISGALVRQVGNITGYTASTSLITVGGAFTAAPSAGDEFVII